MEKVELSFPEKECGFAELYEHFVESVMSLGVMANALDGSVRTAISSATSV
jgi:hypothetical protein